MYVSGQDASCGEGTHIAVTAKIGAGVRIGRNCLIGENVVIDKGARIGDGVSIWHNTVIRDDVTLGEGVVIGHLVLIEQGTSIGAHTTIQSQTHLTGWAIIENYVYFGPAACIINEAHIAAHGRCQKNIQGPRVRHGARIGARSTILPGVTVGINAFLGAGAVATKDIPDGEIWVGNPARFLTQVPPREKI